MTEIALIHWNDVLNQNIPQAVDADAVSFGVGEGKVEIRLHENGHELTIKAFGQMLIRPEVSNQIHISVLGGPDF